MRKRFFTYWIGLFVLGCLTIAPVLAFDPTTQTPELLLDEALTVYYGNLARRDAGQPPLRWNRQLTHASRWFAWDSVANRPSPYCGHQDTNGQWPSDRAVIFGYLGSGGAENAYCGYMQPQDAINGWLNSPGHRNNLLSPGHREIGLGYYRRASDGRGYIAQMFGNDVAYAPVIIENEAINTLNPDVALYIYQPATTGGFAGRRPVTEMMIADNPCFVGASWQPFSNQTRFRLPPGEGWRTVYVKTRDAYGVTAVVSDTIYLGPNPPLAELAATLSDRQSHVTLTGLAHPSLPQVQFSLGWLVDETYATFSLLWGNGERVADSAAWGGGAFRLGLAGWETSAWVYDYNPLVFKDRPLVAYVRLKVANNTSPAEVARFTVKGGGVEYGPLRLRGVDFAAAGQYQEFALPFTFHGADPFLIFQFWRSGNTEVFVDAVTIFTAPQPITNPLTLAVPGGNYRGQGVWVRYTDGTNFTPLSEASMLPVQPANASFMAQRAADPPAPLTITSPCARANWQVAQAEPWVSGVAEEGAMRISVNSAGLATGVYEGTITFAAPGTSFRLTIPVRLQVVEQLFTTYAPLLAR
ncbi:serine protease [Chloroflexus islandicus]|uniref:Serine protease n=1 Tax=Chloroflexus islandicus TaxID=1707952 RepID=A0A178LU66_9CHLR|nr:CAP domain-containing protein [Chloroflexus islandicus]OAN37566.1 serine protease [Chloroflexus islandicus]